MKRPVVPIMSGNVRYLGLSVPEWSIVGILYTGLFAILQVPIFIVTPIFFVLILIYVQILSRLEENVIFVIQASFRIPNVIYGSFKKPLPLSRMRNNDDLAKLIDD